MSILLAQMLKPDPMIARIPESAETNLLGSDFPDSDPSSSDVIFPFRRGSLPRPFDPRPIAWLF